MRVDPLAKPVIIVVEDDPALREETVLSLQLAGLVAVGAADGRMLDQLMNANLVGPVDLVVLDVGLPGASGLEIAAQLATRSPPVGIVMLTGRGLTDERVQGLQQGADAYLVKPADPRELVATVQAVRRRMQQTPAPDGWRLGGGARTLSYGQALPALPLTDLQSRLLLGFRQVPVGQTVGREVLITALGQDAHEADPHRLETLVSRLRQKVRAHWGQDLPLQAVPGQGYALTQPIAFEV